MTNAAPGGRVLDPDAHVPVYLQIAQLLRQAIMSGHWVTGDMLPSENALTGMYEVSPSSVRAAVRVLREEGLVETRRGAGTFVRAVPAKITVRADREDVVTARMPTPAERQTLGVAEGVPVISVRRPGCAEELYDAGRAEVIIGPLPPGLDHVPGMRPKSATVAYRHAVSWVGEQVPAGQRLLNGVIAQSVRALP
jgi:DNA-binding transcriptional regulator YhcF (GntR family)